MALRYWVGSSGDWSDTSHWSASSGGAGGASVPGSSDSVVIDANSSSSALSIVLTSTSITVQSITMSGAYLTTFDRAAGVSATNVLVTSGPLRFSNAQSVTSVSFRPSAGNLSQINQTAVPFIQLFLVSGTVDLASDFKGSAITFFSGTFRSNGHDLTLSGSFTLTASAAKTLDISNSSVDVPTWNGSAASGITLTATGSSITNLGYFHGAGLSYNAVSMRSGGVHIAGSSTWITSLSLAAGSIVNFDASSIHSIGALNANGTSTAKIKLRSVTSGTRFTLTKASGTVNTIYLDLVDSQAAGGAIWNTTSSIDSGNNAGWTFLGPTTTTITPDSIPSAEDVGPVALTPGPVTINPASVASAEAFGSPSITMNVTGVGGLASEEAVGSVTITQSDPPPPPPTDWEAIGREDDKTYVYRVYTSSGSFIGIWNDVDDKPEWTQRINTPGTTTTVTLARSPNTTKQMLADLTTQAGDTLVTQDDFAFTVPYETNNSVGPGTDVEINHNVDIYVAYGQFDNLVTQAEDLLVTQNGDFLLAASGSPNGKRIFSGYVLDYESLYGIEQGVKVTLASHGAELSQALVRSGETVVVSYASQEIALILKSIISSNPGKMTYSAGSIVNTGISAGFKFQLNSKLEAIESIHGQSPDGYYWFGDVATNEVVFKPRATVADHTFVMKHHIKTMALKRTQEQMRNLVYFTGEQNSTTGISILKKYEDAASQVAWRVGLHRITDRRYSVPDNMQRRAEKEMSAYKNPVYTTTVTVSAARYDIETIQLGQMVQIANIDNFVRDLLLQIVSISRADTEVTLQLGELLETQSQIISDINSSLENEQMQTIPNAPS